MTDQNDIYTLTVKRLHRIGAKDPTAQIVALAKEVEQGRAKIRALEEELGKHATLLRLMEQDIEDWKKLAESKVEEIYPEFMRDYKCALEELEGVYEELTELRKQKNEQAPKR